MTSKMIAPCGMNCLLCYAHHRDKNKCDGCWGAFEHKPNSCRKCSITNCEHLAKTESKFCYECEKFPCTRLKNLDKRYRTKYHMSMLENLANIKMYGLGKFIQNEHEKWVCPDCGGTYNVHHHLCSNCKKDFIS